MHGAIDEWSKMIILIFENMFNISSHYSIPVCYALNWIKISMLKNITETRADSKIEGW